MVLKYEDPVVIGITGASGSSLGYKTVQYLLENDLPGMQNIILIGLCIF